MPNHVTNRLTLVTTGVPKAALEAAIADCRGTRTDTTDNELTEVELTFQKLLPRPPALNISAESRAEIIAGVLDPKAMEHRFRLPSPLSYSWVVELGITTQEGFLEMMEENHPESYALGKQMVANALEHGHIHWYPWSCQMWGTKWDAYSVGEWEISDVEASVCFDTAWSSPRPWLEAISEKHPDICFSNRWTDGGGPEGLMVYQAGILVMDQTGMQLDEDEE